MGIRKRGEKFLLCVERGQDAAGRRLRDYATFDTLEEAQAEERKAAARKLLGETRRDSRDTVAAYLDEWLEYKEFDVEPATWAGLKQRCGAWKKALGGTRLADLSPLQIARFEGALRRRGLSDSTVRKYRMALQGALTDAVRWKKLGENPAKLLKPLPENNPEVRWLDAGEQAALLARARSGFKGRRSRWYELILLALATGMRRGELLALRWQDVDWARRRVAMRRSLQLNAGGYRYRTHGKSGSRVVTVPPEVLDELLLYRTRRRQDLALSGAKSELVFCADDGGPVKPDSVRSGFRYLVASAQLDPALHFHCLRHTHATELLIAGIHPKVVAERIGDSVPTVMRTYAHATPDLQDEAAAATGRVLRALIGETT